MSDKPLLSICIPTYNRAELLRSALYSIVRQAAFFKDEVEVIVSDNCSQDHTSEVVAWCQQYGNVRYHRNDENIGGGRNFLRLAQVLAEGEYCWLFGDDDLVREGALEEIIIALNHYNNVDYAFVNNSYENAVERKPGLVENTQSYVGTRYSCSKTEDCLVTSWENIIAFCNDGTLFTFIGNHILRTSVWRQAKFDFQSDAGFPSLEATFPHACVVANHMISRPALYLGKPYVIAFLGAQEWHSSWPMIQLVRVLQLAEFMANQGAKLAMIKRYRNMVLRNSSGSFWKLLTDPNTPGREYLDVEHLFKKYWRNSGFYVMLSQYPSQRYIEPFFPRMKRVLVRLLRGEPLRPNINFSLAAPLTEDSE